MGVSAQKGAFGMALQSTKGVPITEADLNRFLFMRVLSVPQFPNRPTTRLPVEISGGRGSAGSIVNGVDVGGRVSTLVRPVSIGKVLKGFCGSVSTATDSPEAGVYTHTFSPSETKGWMSIMRRVETIIGERFEDVLPGSLEFTFSPGEPLSCNIDFAGRRAVQINPALIPDAVLNWDALDPLSCVSNNAEVKTCFGNACSVASLTCQGARVTLSNELQPDGRVIGSLYQPDFTMTDLVCNIVLDVVIEDATLYRQIYYNAALTGDMSAVVATGRFSLKASSASVISGKAAYYSLTISDEGTSDNTEFTLLPIELAGNSIIKAQMTAQIKLDASNKTFQVVLVNATSGYGF
jgi:hypothetical protein